MMAGLIFLATTLGMLGTGVLAGFLFAFSNVVMPSLNRQDASAAIRTMQTINVIVGNVLFGILLVGTTVLAIWLSGYALTNLAVPSAPQLLLGSAAYLFGGIGVTGIVNVPMNRRLARADPLGNDKDHDWQRFASRWMAWNHVRTVASALACLAYGTALVHL